MLNEVIERITAELIRKKINLDEMRLDSMPEGFPAVII